MRQRHQSCACGAEQHYELHARFAGIAGVSRGPIEAADTCAADDEQEPQPRFRRVVARCPVSFHCGSQVRLKSPGGELLLDVDAGVGQSVVRAVEGRVHAGCDLGSRTDPVASG